METKKRPSWQKHNMAYPHQCTDADIIICYPQKPTEFDVQMELYRSLELLCNELDNQVEVKSEVTVICDGISSRFDLMMFRWFGERCQAMCGIEVKRGGFITNPGQSVKQKSKYNLIEMLGKIPVLYCNGIEEIDKVVKEVEAYCR